jgi:type IV pilus assembly protein PilE
MGKLEMAQKQTGLTLVELMVVVAVLAVLASVAYPLYTNQVQKSRRADAKVALNMIAMAQERFYTLNGAYTATLGSLSVGSDISDGDSKRGYYNLAISQTSNQNFTATATADSGGAQASDSACPQFTINQQGVKGPTGTNCW